MNCAKCQAANPEFKRFCGDCGASLEPRPKEDSVVVPPSERGRVDDTRANRELDELKLTEAVAKRLVEWAKLFAFFAAVPFAIVLFGLGLLGVKTYADFSAKVDGAAQEVEKKLRKAQDDTASTSADAAKLRDQLESLRATLAAAELLSKDVANLASRVHRLEERLTFTQASQISEPLKKALGDTYLHFQDYVEQVGYKPTTETIPIEVVTPKEPALAYYDPAANKIIIDPRYAGDTDILLHEYLHHVLDFGRGNPDGGEPVWAFYDVEYGLNAYYICSFKDLPTYAEKTAKQFPNVLSRVTDLSELHTFAELPPNSPMVDKGEAVWGGAFWELRGRLGREVVDALLFRVWSSLKPTAYAPQGQAFARALLEDGAVKGNATNEAVVRDIWRKRGMKL
jgi:hypothetical protein